MPRTPLPALRGNSIQEIYYTWKYLQPVSGKIWVGGKKLNGIFKRNLAFPAALKAILRLCFFFFSKKSNWMGKVSAVPKRTKCCAGTKSCCEPCSVRWLSETSPSLNLGISSFQLLQTPVLQSVLLNKDRFFKRRKKKSTQAATFHTPVTLSPLPALTPGVSQGTEPPLSPLPHGIWGSAREEKAMTRIISWIQWENCAATTF